MAEDVIAASEWLHEVALIAEALPATYIEQMLEALDAVRERHGRVFVLGVGGSAANASHAVNDLRKIAGLEAYAPTDNIAELTARTNDNGWHTVFESWLKTSRFCNLDALLVLSVNGGTSNISSNIISAIRYACEERATVLAIVGRESGYAFHHANVCVAVPCIDEGRRTPHSESFQAVVWHYLAYALAERNKASVSASASGVPIV